MRFISLLLLIISVVHAEDEQMARIFKEKGVNGTMVVESLDGKTAYIHNGTRAELRLLPASTFKIPNTLIALQEGVISSDTQVIAWDSVMRSVSACNADQNLTTAFRSSCVWFYQRLAKKIGPANYQRYLNLIAYGNGMIGGTDTTFWLEGDLAISAREQVQFLRRLLTGQLPFSPGNVEILQRIMVVDSTPECVLRAKTGFAAETTPKLGWYVGYVKKGPAVWLFAMNMAIKDEKDLALRKELSISVLKAKHIL